MLLHKLIPHNTKKTTQRAERLVKRVKKEYFMRVDKIEGASQRASVSRSFYSGRRCC
uniref:Uncharacterized protein n=1 Tax=Utricularia reniformis TaxID=192314 RepID=A0A1Y0B4T7_9LAMI|nr:hypothetical protein AEK19_MT2263 [Utricularia reniformis]ART32408.1 hypothetical protein AEK19_MT2263 [Utricularia reniformis]